MAAMDLLKLLVLLVAVTSIPIKADGPKKKIRIHLPQSVKHIHHHKKIYITNHPAPSQYAPAFMPSAEGAVAVPTNIALPTVTNIMPLNSVDLIEDQVRVPGLTGSASKLLPLYRARGYYGPTRTEYDEQDYDFAPPSEHVDSYVVPTSMLSPLSESTVHHSSKRVKVLNLNEPGRKKVVRKVKPKRTPVRNKPVASVQQQDEHPVSTFHEQFYSDLQDASTIKKVKKAPRVEKIVDGNTEHIHTYSEEHIHKVVYDDEPKYTGVVGVEPIGAVTAFHPFISLNNGQLLTMASDPYRALAVGSMGAQSQYEYAAYNPRDVTHDHIFHDHGELPGEIDVTKDVLSLPPKVSYNSQGLRVGTGLTKSVKNKYLQRPTKAPPADFSYYESIYSSNRVKPTKAASPTQLYVSSQDENINEYKPISTYRFKDSGSSKIRNKAPSYFGKPSTDYRLKSNVPAPFSVSSKIIHDYKPTAQSYSEVSAGANDLSIYEDPFANFKDSYLNNFEYDNFASSSNLHHSEEKSHKSYSNPDRKAGKKSISTQNIRFGTRNNIKYGDTFANEAISIDENDDAPSALENVDSFDQIQFSGSVTPTSYTAKESSSSFPYYPVMAVKTLSDYHLSVPEASNNNYHYAEAPTSTTSYTSIMAATAAPSHQFQGSQNSDNLTTRSPEFIEDTRSNKRYVENKSNNIANTPARETYRVLKEIQPSQNLYKPRFRTDEYNSSNGLSSSSTERSKVKYGDKI